jgi:ribosome-binding factor A
MRTYRQERIKSLVARELGGIIMREVDVPSGVLVTVSDVVISSKKMEDAKVFVGILPATAVEETMEQLHKFRGLLQHELNKKLNIRPIPRITFAYDKGLESASNIEKVFLENEKEFTE